MNIATERVISRKYCDVVPITPQIIQIIEAMARRDEMKGFKLKTKTGYVIYSSITDDSGDESDRKSHSSSNESINIDEEFLYIDDIELSSPSIAGVDDSKNDNEESSTEIEDDEAESYMIEIN